MPHKIEPQWAVLPLIKPYDGDMRRNLEPYVLTGGFSMANFNLAQWAKRILEKCGIACYVDMLGV